jgi:hypothetical protein
MSQIFLGQLSPGEIQLREREASKQKTWGGGVTLAEKLGFVMQFKPGDVVMLIDAYNQAMAVRAQVEGAMDWGAYQVKVLEGPRSGESLVINWAAVTPIGPGFTESKDDTLPKYLTENVEVLHKFGYQRHGADANGAQVFRKGEHTIKMHQGGGWTHVGHKMGEHGMDLHKHLSQLHGRQESKDEIIRVSASKLSEVNAQRKAAGLKELQLGLKTGG